MERGRGEVNMPEIKWNTDLYNSQHGFVAQYGEDVISWLKPEAGEAILDIGCGTGTLTHKLAESGADVVGVDASEDMIGQAKKAFPQLQFFVKDATGQLFDESFDAAFSNATLHWINDQLAALQSICKSLKRGGRFVFEMGGKHNIESIHTAIKAAMNGEGLADKIPAASNYFPSVAEQAALLEKAGFTVSDVAYFKRPTVLKGEDGMQEWIIQFCGFFFTQLTATERETIIHKAVEILRPTNYRDNTWYADYVRLRMKATKGF
jgi:trans-aconitate methyltransferase